MEQLITEKQLCEQLKVHRNTVRIWRQQGCPYRGAERSYRYDPDLVLRWREQRDKETPGGKRAAELLDAKYAFLETQNGRSLYFKIDDLRDRLPAELQDDFEILINDVIHASFAAGRRAAR